MTLSMLTTLGDGAWARGSSVSCPLDCGALPWSCRGLDKILTIFPTQKECLRFISDTKILDPQKETFLLNEISLASTDNNKLKYDAQLLHRGQTLNKWRNSPNGVLLSTPQSVLTPFLLAQNGLEITTGQNLGRDFLINWLAKNGYLRTSLAWEYGTFAVHGGIIDVYDPSSDYPIRIEFFDEEIDSIRAYQPKTQRSYNQMKSFFLRTMQTNPKGDIIDFLGTDFKLLLISPQKLEKSFNSFKNIWNEVNPPNKSLDDDSWEQFQQNLGDVFKLRMLNKGEGTPLISLDIDSLPNFRGDLARARSYVKTISSAGFEVHLTSSSAPKSDFLGENIHLHPGHSLSGGFLDRNLKELWISDNELFGISEEFLETIDQGMPSDLEGSIAPGDWVIHQDYGVCQFLHTSVENFGGIEFESCILQFADGKKLIMPFSDIYKLSEWSGDNEPNPDSLGSKKWKNAYKKAESEIEEEARQLLDVYATRELSHGRRFGPDGELLKQFEETFPFTETRDQLKAIADIKADMQAPYPMDRIIVGDVGYGKTEVVLRAAVKAVENGAQVAIVVPTTVLAHQHYRTALARTAGLPINIEVISRMVTQSKQKNILSGVANGKIDILIGTHRLFQSDIKFQDLGLLIIDEEHRFGVKHKELLKGLFPSLDILSLSATPIPRSLSMAMRGIKDISLISTPPRSKAEILTITSPWTEEMVYSAVTRELGRGGQVFYLHNKVEDIDKVYLNLKKLLPEARIGVAHGQLRERTLEEVMNQFYEGKLDILVCTTIIESGLDVARANTIIIDDVRLLGLAQMHQVRGRVGRRSELAYAYFLYPENIILPVTSRERLEALGASNIENGGYHLAKRDIEIRGAGEILGSSQHGFKERIGYNLYFKKLRQRVSELRNDATKEVEMDIKFPLQIPTDWLTSSELRIGLYRRLNIINSLKDITDLQEELRDRYGPIPPSVQGLLDMALIRSVGYNLGITKVKCDKLTITVYGEICLPSQNWAYNEKKIAGVTQKTWQSKGGVEGLRKLASELTSLFTNNDDQNKEVTE